MKVVQSNKENQGSKTVFFIKVIPWGITFMKNTVFIDKL